MSEHYLILYALHFSHIHWKNNTSAVILSSMQHTWKLFGSMMQNKLCCQVYFEHYQPTLHQLSCWSSTEFNPNFFPKAPTTHKLMYPCEQGIDLGKGRGQQDTKHKPKNNQSKEKFVALYVHTHTCRNVATLHHTEGSRFSVPQVSLI